MSTKILTEITPTHGDTRHCLEDILAAIASWWDCDHFMMFAFSWGFTFNRIPNEKSGKMIGSGWTDDHLQYFESYHKIILKKQIPLDSESVLTIINTELSNNKPVVIYIDSFNLPWAKVYRKHHSVHCCLVIGATAQNFVCLDPYASQENEMLSFEEYYAGCKGCMTFELMTSYPQKKKEKVYGKDLKQIITELKSNAGISRIKDFSLFVRNDFDIIYEIEGYELDNIKFAPIFYNIRHIINGRYNFTQILNRLEPKFPSCEIGNISNELKSSAKDWEAISGLLAKACYMPRIKNTVHARVADKLLEIAEHEENIMTKLDQILN